VNEVFPFAVYVATTKLEWQWKLRHFVRFSL